MVHLEGHISEAHWPSSYPHPLCSIQIDNVISFWYHLSDAHNLHRVNKKGQKCCWEAVTSKDNNYLQLETPHQGRKKQKLTRQKETVEIKAIEYSPLHSS